MSYRDREEEPGGSGFDGRPSGGDESGGGPTNRQLGWLAVGALVVVVIAVVIIVVSTTGSNGNSNHNADANVAGTATAPAHPRTATQSTTSTATATTSPASGGALEPAGGPVPSGFEPDSFTAVSDELWWVMGSASCSSPPCTSIVRTANGGRSFVGIPAPRTSDVSNLRFANAQDGYAYGPQLWTTHDGGASWTQVTVSGTVTSLATSAGDVFVGTSQGLLRSPVGSDSFDQIESGDIPSVWTQGDDLYVDSQSSSGSPTLLSSSDDGSSFQQYAAPSGVVQCSFSSTGGGVIWAPCATGTEGSVWVSTDGGAEWDATDPAAGQGEGVPNSAAFAAASGQTAVYGASQLFRTTDGGQTWGAVTGFPGADETVAYLGFTDATHGVAILDASSSSESISQLYVTDDGGVSYNPVSISAG